MAEAEVCVVGSGAGGAVAAWALARKGIAVRLLETGPRFDPARYATHHPLFELEPSAFAQVAREPRRKSYESDESAPFTPGFEHLRSRSPTLLSTPVERRLPFRWSRALGVGGSTLHYQGEAHRFPAHAFRMRSERGVAADWPIDYEVLAPFYQRVEELLGVCGDPGNPFKPPRGAFVRPAHPLSRLSRRVGQGARKLGWAHLPNTLAVLSQGRDGREACHYCNGCARGCGVKAKSSVDVAVIPQAEATGRLELVTDFHVTRLARADDGRVTGVIGFDADGVERRIGAAAVVLAAGAIETPRILLNSTGERHSLGVGNESDQVGRHLTEFLYVDRYGVLDESIDSFVGLPLDSRIWDFNGADGKGDRPGGFVLGQAVGWYEGPATFAREGVPGFGRKHREAMAKRFGGGVELLGIAEQLPRPENRVTLSANADTWGAPLARVTTRLDDEDRAVLSEMHRRLGELGEAVGLDGFVAQLSAYDLPNATHVAGTCRMGHDPEHSVADAFGALHQHPNVWVADASLLVTQGAGDSPSLTIQALALRAAEELARRLRRLEV